MNLEHKSRSYKNIIHLWLIGRRERWRKEMKGREMRERACILPDILKHFLPRNLGNHIEFFIGSYAEQHRIAFTITSLQEIARAWKKFLTGSH